MMKTSGGNLLSEISKVITSAHIDDNIAEKAVHNRSLYCFRLINPTVESLTLAPLRKCSVMGFQEL